MNRLLTRWDIAVFLALNAVALMYSESRGLSLTGGVSFLECFLGANAIFVTWILNKHKWRMKKPEEA